jgi:succinate dehydrogenase / fumarate reductase cytochrome b subunit
MSTNTLEIGPALARWRILAAGYTLWNTTIGKKIAMAATGIVLTGFVFAHMLGNLKIYKGEAAFNAYALWLREVGAPLLGHEQALWIFRLVLLAAVALHMWAAWQLTRTGWAARTVKYDQRQYLEADYASRTMRWGGVLIGLFVAYHILHFTLGVVGYGAGQFSQVSVYRNVVAGFSLWYISAFYMAAMVVLALHLYHGVWSMLQTMGVIAAKGDVLYRVLSLLLALAIALGNISVPASVLLGIVK